MNQQSAAAVDPSQPVQTNPVALEALAAISAQAVTKLRALPMPPGDRPRLTAVYAQVDRLIALLRSEAQAFRAGKSATAREILAKVNAAGRTANSLSNAYGLTTCGS
jgi:hypothetical protein